MKATNHAVSAPAAPTTWCPSLARDVGPDHRCPACTIQGTLNAANETVALLRAEVARLTTDLQRARAALFDESEAHALTARKLERAKAERDVLRGDIDELASLLNRRNGPDPDEHSPRAHGVSQWGGW